MEFTKEQIESMRKEDGNFSEPDVKAVEQITGQDWPDVYKQAMEAEPDIPEGSPTKDWTRDTKLEFINEHGHEAYKKLVDSRK